MFACIADILYVDLYFIHVHHYIPFCHVSSFDTKRTSGFLVAAMLAIGARYSTLQGHDALADVLGDVVSKSLGNCITSDHTLARNIDLQRAAMLWTLQRSTGSRRLMELTEVLRNTHCVALRQM